METLLELRRQGGTGALVDLPPDAVRDSDEDSPHQRPVLNLWVFEEEVECHRFAMLGDVVIGTTGACDIQIDCEALHPEHLEIRPNTGGAMFRAIGGAPVWVADRVLDGTEQLPFGTVVALAHFVVSVFPNAQEAYRQPVPDPPQVLELE